MNGDNALPPTGLHASGESHCTTGAIGCRGWGSQYTHIPLTNLSRVESGLGLRNAFSSEGVESSQIVIIARDSRHLTLLLWPSVPASGLALRSECPASSFKQGILI